MGTGLGAAFSGGGHTKYVAGARQSHCASFAPRLPRTDSRKGTKGPQGEVLIITQCEQDTERPQVA